MISFLVIILFACFFHNSFEIISSISELEPLSDSSVVSLITRFNFNEGGTYKLSIRASVSSFLIIFETFSNCEFFFKFLNKTIIKQKKNK